MHYSRYLIDYLKNLSRLCEESSLITCDFVDYYVFKIDYDVAKKNISGLLGFRETKLLPTLYVET